MAEEIKGYDGTPLGEFDASIVRGNETGALVFGILGLVFSCSGLLGLIFSNVARKKAAPVLLRTPSGKAKAGKVLGTIGLVFSIITLVAAVLTGIIVAIAANTSFSYGF